MIDVREWLVGRTPRPPREIADRLAALAGESRVENEAGLAELFVQQAASLLSRAASDRTGATELLLADSLITYAMEAAASDHDRFEEIAERAMMVIAQAGRVQA